MAAAAAILLLIARGTAAEEGPAMSTDPAVWCVLENVPKVSFYAGGGPPEDDPFPSCLRSFLQFYEPDSDLKGEQIDQKDAWHDVHNLVMGTSGAAFRLGWHVTDPSTSMMDMALTVPDPVEGWRRSFEAIGYDCEILLKNDFAKRLGIDQKNDPTEADFRKRIIASIRDKRRPVLSFGAIDAPECGMITGYDQGGDTLIGWDYFQNEKTETEPFGYYRKSDWFKSIQGIIVIGEKRKRPPLRAVYIEALQRALPIMRTPHVRGFATGQAAYTTWAESLFRDADFDTKDMAKVRSLHGLTSGNGGTLAEARAWGAPFLNNAAKALPEAADELNAAAGCFSAEHDLVWAVWEFMKADGKDDNDQKRFADSGTRHHRIAPLIYQMRDHDARAAKHIEEALRILGKLPAEEKVVLEGVPKIGYGVRLCPFPGVVEACMKYLHQPCDYDHVVATSGAAFRRLWNRDDGGNVGLLHFAPECHDRAFHALGYGCRQIPYKDKAKMIDAIKESISRGKPAIIYGIVGPPEPGIVTGYERGGEVIYGYSYFQAPTDADYYRQENWYQEQGQWYTEADRCAAVIITNKDTYSPPPVETLVSTLDYAIKLSRQPTWPGVKDHSNGLAACEDWAKGLETDADYPLDDPQILATRLMVHGDQCVMLGDRASAAAYLRNSAKLAPNAADDLLAAADLYAKVAGMMDGVWPWGDPDMGPERARAFADRDTRLKLAKVVREARNYEEKAVERLEKAVSTIRAEALQKK